MTYQYKLVMIGALAVTAGSALALPPNSYIVKPIRTPADLVGQIKTSKVVSDRYQRHFGMSQGEVIVFVKSLRPAKLERTGIYSVWNVPAKTGELRMRMLRMTAGTPVFVDWNDRPVMVTVCGNPMIPGRSMGSSNEVVAEVGTPSQDSIVTIANPQPTVVEAPVVVDHREPVMPDLQEESIVTIIPRRQNYGALALIPILGGLTLINRKSTPDPEPDPVPEPATMIAVGTGVAAMIAKRKRA